MSFLAEWAHAEGYVQAEVAGDRVVALTPTATNQGQLVVGTIYSVHERYTFATVASAAEALEEWREAGFAGEPTGWHRHQPSNRRRTDGDPDQEYIAP